MPGTFFAYDPQNGALYAQTYALYSNVPDDKRLFFYDAEGNDCANFASQCIWAGYGGWLPGVDAATVEENRRRIRANVRQTSAWYGSASHAGTTKWTRVEELFAYVAARKQIGPSGNLIVTGDWDAIRPDMIRQGDVIQLVVTGYMSHRFGHNLYVTRAGHTFNDIAICCHSYDRLNAPLSSFSSFPDAYPRARVIRFHPAAFAK
jgi:hypothetical protein